MKRILSPLLALVLLALFPAAVVAGTDEFLGDANIYAGVPGSMTRPNVLFIIDNSQSTTDAAAGLPYRYDSLWSGVYPGVYSPYAVYEIDNQGDVAQGGPVIDNYWTLTDVGVCVEDGVYNYSPYYALVYRGTYSGAGSSEFPNINKSDGKCNFDSPIGKVYALGNYLNYTKTVALAPACAEAPIVKACDWVPKTSSWNCSSPEYYKLKQTHTSAAQNGKTPWVNNSSDLAYWTALVPPPAGVETLTNYVGQWAANTTYTMPVCPPPPAAKSQRRIMFEALQSAIAASAGAVDFGAMVYNQTGGAELVFPISNLTEGVANWFSVDWFVENDCNPSWGWAKDTNFCRFMWAIPGEIDQWVWDPALGVSVLTEQQTGADLIPGQTGRPQAEAVFDAGHYLGATYGSVNNSLGQWTRPPEKPCKLDHVILLTNGFTSNDNFNNVAVASVIGDADGDQYPDERTYGGGSHWLDDVAKHLKQNYDITTHTVVAFQEQDSLLQNAAKDGGGKFYQAYNAEELAEALLKLLASIINESSTSFVAPVVPASTTNRTVSSSKVYLGLFRPRAVPPWNGNIKKYSLGSNNTLLAADGTSATYPSGDFDPDSISYWSLIGGVVPSADGDIDPNGTDPNKPHGDGGQVDAGGTGGVLLKRMQTLKATILADRSSWHEDQWRKIYTVTGSNGDLSAAANRFILSNALITNAVLGAQPMPGDPAAPDFADKLDLHLEEGTPLWRDNLIRFINGFADNEAMNLGVASSIDVRDWVLGDILHSRPVSINYSKYNGDADGNAIQAGVQPIENICPPDDDPIPNSTTVNTSILFVGSNDGMLHAFRDCDGKELWAFIPPNVLSSLKYVRDPQSDGHPTFVDGAPSVFVHDQNNNGVIEANGGDKVVLIFGQRRGGGTSPLDNNSRGAYFALDVTDYTAPKLLWMVDNQQERRFGAASALYVTAGPHDLGEPWSQPRLAKVPVDDDSFKIVAFVGAGYDNREDLRYGQTQGFPSYAARSSIDINDSEALRGGEVDGSDDPPLTSDGSVAATNAIVLSNGTAILPRGRGLLALEVAKLTRTTGPDGNPTYTAEVLPTAANTVGRVHWNYTRANNSNASLVYSIPSDLAVLDVDGNGYADRIYVGDTGGNLWRFNIAGATTANWSGDIIFSSNPSSGTDTGRKIFYRPQITYVGGYPHIYFGTGDREHPLNRAVIDRMYSIIDWGQTTAMGIDEDKLVNVTTNQLQESQTESTVASILAQLHSRPATGVPLTDSANDSLKYGWMIKADGTQRGASTSLGEKVLAPATVFNGQVFFSTYQLLTGAIAGCEAGNLGISRLYQLDYLTGEAVYNLNVGNDTTTTTNERARTSEGKILASSDRVRQLGEGIPSGIVTIVDASGNVTMLISSSDKVEASGLPDVKLITPVYWMQW